MEYTINDLRINGDILTTNTTLYLNGGITITVDIAHYLPEINQNILNRISSEQLRLDEINITTDLI